MVPFNGCVAARRSEDDKSINSGHKEHGYTIHHATFNNLSFKRQVHIILATIINAQYLAMLCLILPHRDSFHGHSTSPEGIPGNLLAECKWVQATWYPWKHIGNALLAPAHTQPARHYTRSWLNCQGSARTVSNNTGVLMYLGTMGFRTTNADHSNICEIDKYTSDLCCIDLAKWNDNVRIFKCRWKLT